jgi:hypothetical protein
MSAANSAFLFLVLVCYFRSREGVFLQSMLGPEICLLVRLFFLATSLPEKFSAAFAA